MKRTVIVPILLVVLAVFFSRSALERTLERQVSIPVDEVEGVDFFIEQPVVIQYNDQSGQTETKVVATRLNYYASEKSTELLSPIFDIEGENYAWQVAAKNAKQQGDEQPIVLGGIVNIVQTNTDQPIELTTSNLVLNTVNETASTEAPTDITTPESTTQAKGIRVDFKENQIDLLSNVTTTIVPAEANK